MAGDPYEVLGVGKNATQEAVRRAFRKQVMMCHPDHNPDDPDASKRTQELISAFKAIGKTDEKSAQDRARLARAQAVCYTPIERPSNVFLFFERFTFIALVLAALFLVASLGYSYYVSKQPTVYRPRFIMDVSGTTSASYVPGQKASYSSNWYHPPEAGKDR